MIVNLLEKTALFQTYRALDVQTLNCLTGETKTWVSSLLILLWEWVCGTDLFGVPTNIIEIIGHELEGLLYKWANAALPYWSVPEVLGWKAVAQALEAVYLMLLIFLSLPPKESSGPPGKVRQ